MTYIRKLTIRGYRAILDAITLDDLGPVVSIHGDNAVGKSSVLRAVELVSRLCGHLPDALAGPGLPWPEDAFYDTFGQDPWMFNHSAAGVVELSATYNDELEVAFRVTRQADARIRLEILTVRAGACDLLDDLHRAEARQRDLNDTLELHGAPGEGVNLDGEEMPAEVADELVAAELAAGHQAIQFAVVGRACASMPSPSLPVPAALRQAWCAGYTSRDRAIRTAVRTIAADFGEMFPALGEGSLEPLENAPRYPQDVGWFEQGGDATPLDQLGGGVQSTFSTLGPLALSGEPIRLIEEPEAFVGLEAAEELAKALRNVVTLGIARQLWIATHSITLAMDQLWIVERRDGTTRVTRATRPDLLRFAPSDTPPQPMSLGRMGNDGSVRLPKAVIEGLGFSTADPVYFVPSAHGFEIVNGETYDSLTGDDSA